MTVFIVGCWTPLRGYRGLVFSSALDMVIPPLIVDF
jgi:hypothetical protein